jgi:transposase
MDNARVLYATEGKDGCTVERFANDLIEHGGKPENVKEFAIDMSQAYVSGIECNFPAAHITFDKFHIMKLMNNALDQVRRREVKEEPILKGTRYIFLKNEDNLTVTQYQTLQSLSKKRLRTARAYKFKLALQEILNKEHCQGLAESLLKRLIGWGLRSRMPEIKTFANTIKSHLPGILRYYVSGLTSGLVEGLNSKIQEIKRRSRGFPNTSHFINMIYLCIGRLNVPMLFGTGKPVTAMNESVIRRVLPAGVAY